MTFLLSLIQLPNADFRKSNTYKLFKENTIQYFKLNNSLHTLPLLTGHRLVCQYLFEHPHLFCTLLFFIVLYYF